MAEDKLTGQNSDLELLLAQAERLALSGDHRGATDALTQAVNSFPQNKKALRRQIQHARAVADFDRWLDALNQLIELAPNDAGLHMQHSVAANQSGDAFLFWRSIERAHDIFRAGAIRGNVGALCGLLRTVTRRGAHDETEQLLRVVLAEAHRNHEALPIRTAADTLIWLGDIEGLRFLADGLDAAKLDQEAMIELADLAIKLEQTDRACDLISSLTSTTRRAAELRAWHAVQVGDVATATALIESISFPNSLSHVRVLDASEPSGLTARATPPNFGGDPIVITMCRNERQRLPQWLEHYRGLGIKHFLAIDNGSDDATPDYLAAQSDVYVFDAAGDFRRHASGRRWVNELIEAHCDGSWCIVVDADELLVFPGDHSGIDRYVAHLDDGGAHVVFGPAIDMHAERLGEWGGADAPLGEQFPYFDARTRVIGSRNSPYLAVAGGLRNRHLSKVMPENLLTKPVMVRGGTGVRFLSPHMTTPGRPAATTCAVLHYKFAVDPVPRQAFTSAKGVFARYLAQDIRATRDLELLTEHSVRYRNSDQLVELGLLRRG